MTFTDDKACTCRWRTLPLTGQDGQRKWLGYLLKQLPQTGSHPNPNGLLSTERAPRRPSDQGHWTPAPATAACRLDDVASPPRAAIPETAAYRERHETTRSLPPSSSAAMQACPATSSGTIEGEEEGRRGWRRNPSHRPCRPRGRHGGPSFRGKRFREYDSRKVRI